MTSPAAAKSYYRSSDYYATTPGEWIGKGAEMLGLTGTTSTEQFDSLADNLDPRTGTPLTTYTRDGRRVGLDMTFNSTKSVGVARELAGPDNTGDPRIESAHREAVAYTMRIVETDMCGRVRVGGKDEDRVTGNLVAYRVTHRDTRISAEDNRPDMSLHDHVFIFNATFDPVEQKWKAAQIGQIKHDAPYYEAVYHNRLASNLRELGYGIRREGKAFEVAGVSRELIQKFSRRRQYIKAVADKLGITSAAGMDKLGATTRLGKAKEMADDLNRYYVSRLTDKERQQLNHLEGQPSFVSSDGAAVRFAIEHETHKRSVVEARKLYETAIRHGIGSVTPEGVEAEATRQGVLLSGSEATTRDRLAEEAIVIDFARDGRATCAPVSTAGDPSLSDFLTDEQRRAIVTLLKSTNAVNVVDAGQGTGKTTMLEEYGRVLADRGVRTTWLGTTHTAVDELAKRNLPAVTVAAFLKSNSAQASAAGTRIVLDEASMLSHMDSYRLFRFASENGCRIDLVGDSKQHKTPVAGDPLQLLTRFAGIKPITMTKTMRQSGRLKEAMEGIRNGDVLGGHDILSELGMVHELPQDELAQRAAELYLRWTANGEYVPVVSPTHAQADEIALLIRNGLRARGDLTGDDHVIRRLTSLNMTPPELREARKEKPEGVVLLGYGAYREETVALAVGDVVRTTMRGKSKDGRHFVNAGQRYTVAGFTETGDPMLNNGWVIDKNWGGLAQGYVSTSQAVQGKTSANGIAVYGTPSLVATRQEGFYVPVSRVRREVAVLTDSNAALREAIQRQDSRKSATELLRPGSAPKSRQRVRSLIDRIKATYRQLRGTAADAIREVTRQPERELSYGR
jgi:conjugative relaxase-like TrwC/TraI family protein